MRQATERRLTNVVGEAHGFADLDEFRGGILPLVRQLVSCDVASYNEVDDDPSRMWGFADPAMPPDAPMRWARLAHEHPVLAYVRRTADGRPRRISDFLDRDAFHATALYRDFYRTVGVEAQVSFTLPSRPPIVVGIALNRGDGDFSDEECRLLGMARPHLIQAYRTAELSSARAATLAALERGLDAVGNPLLVADAHGRITFATVAARRLLRDALGEDAGAERLPRQLTDALARRRARGAAVTEPLLLGSRDGLVLTVRVLPGADGDGTSILLLEPGTGGMTLAALRGLGLTAREAEALRWIALGRSGREAARLMSISPRTVEKHLQHVHAKLGVSSSSQAAATAWAAVGVRYPREDGTGAGTAAGD